MFRTAIIGCGRIASGYDREVPTEWSATHAGAYHLCPDTELVAVADPDSKALKAFQDKWGVKRGYLDYRELLEREKLDIVSLCLPTAYHFPAFQETIDAGVSAIFCEKPLSHDLDEAVRMVEMARGRVVAVNYFRRWNPTLARLAQGFRQKEYGEVVNVVIRYPKGMLVNASHFIDLVRWFWGEPVAVKFLRTVSADPVDPGIDFSLSLAGGGMAYFINVPGIDFVFAEVDIITTQGRLVIAQRGQKVLTYPLVAEPHYRLFSIVGEPEIRETEWRNCTTRAVQEIVDVMCGATSVTTCTMGDGLRTMEICAAITSQLPA